MRSGAHFSLASLLRAALSASIALLERSCFASAMPPYRTRRRFLPSAFTSAEGDLLFAARSCHAAVRGATRCCRCGAPSREGGAFVFDSLPALFALHPCHRATRARGRDIDAPVRAGWRAFDGRSNDFVFTFMIVDVLCSWRGRDVEVASPIHDDAHMCRDAAET